MKSAFVVALAVALLSAAPSVFAVPPLPSGSPNPDKIEGYCGDQGGTYWPPGPESSTYGCLLPDGSVVVCGGSLGGCDTIEASIVVLPPKLPLSAIDLKLGLETKADVKTANDKLNLLEEMMIDLAILVEDECEPPIFVP